MDFVREGDPGIIAAPIDFLGINCYSRSVVRGEATPEGENAPREVIPGDDLAAMGWAIYPEGLYDLLCRLHFEYGFPALVVAEDGAAFDDEIGPDGIVNDARRRCLRHAAHACTWQPVDVCAQGRGGASLRASATMAM